MGVIFQDVVPLFKRKKEQLWVRLLAISGSQKRGSASAGLGRSSGLGPLAGFVQAAQDLLPDPTLKGKIMGCKNFLQGPSWVITDSSAGWDRVAWVWYMRQSTRSWAAMSQSNC